MAVKDITKEVERMREQIESLIRMNQRLNLILGYGMAFIFELTENFPEDKKEKYYWLTEAVENIIYQDKPLPRMP